MKKNIVICLFALTALTACNSNDKAKGETPSADNTASTPAESETTEGTGTFTVDGQSFSGKVTRETLAKNQMQLSCQQDEPFTMIQIQFKDEADFKSASSFKPSDGFMTIEAGTAHVNVMKGEEFTTSSSLGGTIERSGNTVTIKDLELQDVAKQKKIKVSAELKF